MYSNARERFQFGLGAPLTRIVKYLIIINVAVFFIENLVLLAADASIFKPYFALRTDFLQNFQLWQVVTYMFLHGDGDVLHLFFNMLLLWIFGSEVEDKWGSRPFLNYYLICGIGAGLVQVLSHYVILPDEAHRQIVGASGAVFGLILAFAWIDPEREITFFLMLIMPIRIKAKYLAMIAGGFALFSGLFSLDNVAHFAHLGGMLVGYLYLKLDMPKVSISEWASKRKETREIIKLARKRNHEQQLRKDVDQILDKINDVGIENLTAEEKNILKEASKYLSQEKEDER